jgi:Calcineurin-like phosphoesterase
MARTDQLAVAVMLRTGGLSWAAMTCSDRPALAMMRRTSRPAWTAIRAASDGGRWVRHSLVIAALLGAVGCDRGRAHDPAPSTPSSPVAIAPSAATTGSSQVATPPSPPPASAAVVPGCRVDPIPLRLPAPKRLVAIGDLHGDLAGARAALRAAGAIDDRDHWIGGELVVVQTGDVLDRGDDERALLDLIAALETEARAAGGAFVQLLGNHELMNGAGDFRYVTPAGFHAFDGAGDAAPGDAPPEVRSRIAALGAGHSYARRLAHHAVIAIVGDTVFSHAGVLPDWAGRVDEVNRNARCWLDGQASQPPAALTSDDSPVWTRAYGGPAVDCAQLAAALAAQQAKRMVVGHTVQAAGITSACDGALWRIDVGLSRYYGGPIEVLEIVPGAPPKILHGSRG